MQGRDNPREFVFFQPEFSAGLSLPLCLLLILGRKIPLFGFCGALHLLSGFLLFSPFKFFDLMVQKTMVFHHISANRIQHEFFIYFLL